MNKNKRLIILGLMSGTSLDGLDLCLAEFWKSNNNWQYQIHKTSTISYPKNIQDKLLKAIHLSALEMVKLDTELGVYFGQSVNQFLKSVNFKVDYIASHGHTVFHQPKNGFTLQIGSGNHIFAQTNIPTIADFRSLDVALGGQGAPLVPIGDKLLFNNFKACINFGGIANLSYEINGERKAFDICPVNMALNDLCKALNIPYDDKGKIAKSGKVLKCLLSDLNRLSYYSKLPPKSLGIEYYQESIQPLILNKKNTTEDCLHTYCHHIANQISISLKNISKGHVLVSGGGVYNDFLIQLIQNQVDHELIIPSTQIIEFKEALIFAFLGALKINKKTNVLKSVTGAKQDSCSGVLFE